MDFPRNLFYYYFLEILLKNNELVFCEFQHTPLVSFHLHDPSEFAVDFEQVIISVILFSAFVPRQQHIPLVLSCLHNPSTLAAAADFEQVTVPVICFLPCLLSRY